MIFDKNTGLEGLLNKGLFYGSFLASLGAGMFLGEIADVYLARPVTQKYSPGLNPYLTFAASTVTGMALTMLGWKRLIAKPLYDRIKPQK